MTDNDLKLIIEKIKEGKYTDADLQKLRQVLINNDNAQVSLQLGKFNVNIGEGKDIHIGDKIYYQWDEKAVKALVKQIQSKNADEISLFITKLKYAQFKGEEGDRFTGSFYTYKVWLEDIFQEKSNEENYSQKYNITGKWYSEVYKEINAFGLTVDYPWGKTKKPYGTFIIVIEVLNGGINSSVKVDRYNDSPNNYAADKVEKLIYSKISELRFV